MISQTHFSIAYLHRAERVDLHVELGKARDFLPGHRDGEVAYEVLEQLQGHGA